MEKSADLPADTKAVPHVTEFEDLVDVLPGLAERSRLLNESIKSMEAEKKEINAQIGSLLEAVEQKSIRGDRWVAVRVEGGVSETISPELLLQKGVKMEVIVAATVKKQKAGYIQVRELKIGGE